MSKKIIEKAIDSYITGTNAVNTLIVNRLGIDDYDGTDPITKTKKLPYIQWDLINDTAELTSCDLIETYRYQFRLVHNNYNSLRDLVDAFKALMEHNTCRDALNTLITDQNLMNVRLELNLPLPIEDQVYKQHIFQYSFQLNKLRA